MALKPAGTKVNGTKRNWYQSKTSNKVIGANITTTKETDTGDFCIKRN